MQRLQKSCDTLNYWAADRYDVRWWPHAEQAMPHSLQGLVDSAHHIRYWWRISLGDIQNLPTFWVLALFGTFYNFSFRVQTCRHLGGVCVCFLKSARKRRFTNVWVSGGGFDIFQRSTTHGTVHTNTALHRLSIFIQNHCHCQHCFFQAGRGPH